MFGFLMLFTTEAMSGGEYSSVDILASLPMKLASIAGC